MSSLINFTRSEFEELKNTIDEILAGDHEGISFSDPSTGNRIVFALVEDNTQDKENLASVEKLKEAGATSETIAMLRMVSDITGKPFSLVTEEYLSIPSGSINANLN